MGIKTIGFFHAVSAAVLIFIGAACASAALSDVPGAGQEVSGADVKSWAKVDFYNRVVKAGVTVPFAVIKNPPSRPGAGPAGAVAVLEFPLVVQDTTFIEHFELHYQKRGQGTDLFRESHFGLRFCSFPVAEFLKITSPDPRVPDKSRIPKGFVYPGPEEAAYQVGVRAMKPKDLGKKSDYVLTVGFYGGSMVFIEPAVTREFLMGKRDFTLEIPMPGVVGRGYETHYPTRFRASYDARTDSYSFVFDRFRKLER